MSLSVYRLRELLDRYPPDARVHAYEGEDTGISIHTIDCELFAWIRLRDGDQDDEQDPRELELKS